MEYGSLYVTIRSSCYRVFRFDALLRFNGRVSAELDIGIFPTGYPTDNTDKHTISKPVCDAKFVHSSGNMLTLVHIDYDDIKPGDSNDFTYSFHNSGWPAPIRYKVIAYQTLLLLFLL